MERFHPRAWFLGQLLRRLAPAARLRRMNKVVDDLAIGPGHRVLDLGGTTEIWGLVSVPLDITILNLPGVPVDRTPHGPHRFTFVEGDATDVTAYGDKTFDVVFSNSVIEHVGGPEKQAAFAREVRRLASRYAVQTPSIHFPIEAHTGYPFWWYYPPAIKRAIFRRWRKTLPAYGVMVEGTTVISRRALATFFPDAIISTERVLGVPKSYTAWKGAAR
jgi:hypothetical protein